ncbi:TlpA family protein disulfide reductase [Aquabacterium sp.]|uniref:TlpA family protein disulfide reductase n=1 Tax=Aquabacterium sp. TaxID=1872578 RepID=UPI0035B2CCFC
MTFKANMVKCAVSGVLGWGLGLGMMMPAQAVEAGQPAPAFVLPQQSGGSLSLADLKGKLVYLDFWASWCGPCRQSFPWMNELQAKYGARGLKVVGINVDSRRADADAFLSQLPAQFAVVFDGKGEAPGAYKIKGMPSSYLIAPDGHVIKVHAGFRAEDRKELEAAIEAALQSGRGQ